MGSNAFKAEELDLIRELAVNNAETARAVVKIAEQHATFLGEKLLTEVDNSKLAELKAKYDGARSVLIELQRVLVRDRMKVLNPK